MATSLVCVPRDSQMAAREMIGRDVRVFVSPAASDSPPRQSAGKEVAEPDDFYDLTPDDYARLMSKQSEDRFLKTAKIRQAEAAARRSRITKTTIRVQFPDSIVVEAEFRSSDLVAELVKLLEKVLIKPEMPFSLFITPPKKILKDYTITFYDAGLVPGALVYFSYNDEFQGPFLKQMVLDLQHLDQESKENAVAPPASPPRVASPEEIPPPSSRQIAVNKGSKPKPKWLKLGK